MSHYQERLEQDLAEIRGEVSAVGEVVAGAVQAAVSALLAGDRARAYATVLGDLAINRRIRRLDQRCHAFVARHLPSAGHLRFISSVLRSDVALERVGDYAVTIAREAAQLGKRPPESVARDVDLLADQAVQLLRGAVEAFVSGSAERARGALGLAGQVHHTFRNVLDDLIAEGEQSGHSLAELFALLVILNRLERVGDQAKNLCEEAVFAATGETKAPKVYHVLFVDERDDSYTQLAVAYARKAFPESGKYASAGWQPASRLEPRTALFLERHGYDLAGLAPTKLDASRERLNDFHLVVSLGGDLLAKIDGMPFHTVYLEWDLAPMPADLDQQRAEALLAERHRELAARIHGLVETLRGEDAR